MNATADLETRHVVFSGFAPKIDYLAIMSLHQLLKHDAAFQVLLKFRWCLVFRSIVKLY
jgi:hypothetical protein